MIVVGAWVLMTVVLSISYASTLTSFLSVKKLGPVINSLEDLSNSKDTQLVGQAGTEIFDQFLV